MPMTNSARLTERESFLARADQARAEADKANLQNVRDRCLRAEAAWLMMAAKAERAERMRAEELVRKQGASMVS